MDLPEPDGVEYATDENGEVSIEKEDISEIVEDDEFSEDSVEIPDDTDGDLTVEVIDNGKKIEIVANLSFDDFADGIVEMSENMDDSIGEAKQVFYKKRKVGTYIGAGAGRTKIYFNTNIVGCNKHDKNTKSITTKQFALQNSDCSKSVKLGLLAYNSPALNLLYWRSKYCVIEGMTSAIGDNKNNIYCNGKKKSGHVNCSWFRGIGHSEQFHTHK